MSRPQTPGSHLRLLRPDAVPLVEVDTFSANPGLRAEIADRELVHGHHDLLTDRHWIFNGPGAYSAAVAIGKLIDGALQQDLSLNSVTPLTFHPRELPGHQRIQRAFLGLISDAMAEPGSYEPAVDRLITVTNQQVLALNSPYILPLR